MKESDLVVLCWASFLFCLAETSKGFYIDGLLVVAENYKRLMVVKIVEKKASEKLRS